jgi:hypothetical protein
MNKKIMATFAIVLIALSMAGFAYAHWSDTVKIEGTVNMGELIVGILKDAYGLDKDYIKTETTNGGPEEKPTTCDATITMSEEQTSVHHDPTVTVYHKMTAEINNAYPQWDLHLEFKIKNAGTIPAIVKPAVITGRDTKDGEDLTFNVISATWVGGDHYEIVMEIVDPNAGGYDVLENPIPAPIINIKISLWEPLDEQLEPCHDYPVHIDLDFKQEAEECHTYTFSVVWEFIQWNKA